LFTLAGASAAFAQSMGLGSDAIYARFMRSDAADRMPAAALQAPGPNAQHQIYLGIDRNVAIEQARANGELPRAAAATPAAAPAVIGYDMYARNAMAAAAKQGMR
jgi:hypothetical protein